MSHPELTWQELLDRFTTSCPDHVLRQIHSEKDVHQKIQLCLFDKNIKKSVHDWIKHRVKKNKFIKNEEKSKDLRVEGNKVFAGSNPEQALHIYTKSILAAPDGSQELTLSYGNLSAVLFYMQRYKDCLSAIDKCLDSDNDTRCLKLLLRKCKALLHLGLVKESSRVLDKCESVLNKISPSHTDLLKFHSEIKECKKNIALAFQADESLKPKDDPQLQKPDIFKNTQFPFATQHISLKKTGDKGRHVIADKKLKFGSLLFTERPVAFVVLPQYRLYYCNHCCHYIHCPIPCSECSGLVYCSETCRDAAKPYHRYECGGGLSIAYSTGIAHLALRLALIRPLDALGYHRSAGLLHHIDLMPPEDVYNYALTGYALSLYLEEVGFSKADDLVVDITLNIGRLITNGHSIEDIRSSDTGSRVTMETEDKIATAIYPSASMMNHSCRSNIANCFFGQYLFVKASRDIDKGEEVFNCYGVDCFRNSRMERRQVLRSQYKFDCECDACTSVIDPHDTVTALTCSKCRGPVISNLCIECNHQQSLTKQTLRILENANDKYSLGMDYFRRDWSKALEIFEQVLETRQLYLYKFNKDVGLLHDRIVKCYSALGNYDKAYKLLVEYNIPHISGWYGPKSIECANVMNNCINVLCCTIMNKYGAHSPDCDVQDSVKVVECIKMIEQVEVLFDVYYGPWSDKYQKLMKYKNFLVPLSQVWQLFLPPKQI